MRLEQFQSADKKPLGEGEERKVFLDPNREERVIAETKDQEVKETPRQLKGRYYLTKIVHGLLPENIPDVYQAGEAKEENGSTQTTDRERIVLTAGHEKLRAALRDNDEKAIEEARKDLVTDMGAEMSALDMNLSEIGLGFSIDDSNVGNYMRDGQGNVRYLESFKPWQKDIVNPQELEVLFDEDELREAIERLADEKTRNECLRYLDRLLELLEEEKRSLQEQNEPERPDCRERVAAFETKLAPYLTKESLAYLNAITSVPEALADIKRKGVNLILGEILAELQAMRSETNLSQEEYERLLAQRNTLMRAYGTLRNGTIDRSEPK